MKPLMLSSKKWFLSCAAMLATGWLVVVVGVEPHTEYQHTAGQMPGATSREMDLFHKESTYGVYVSVIDHFLREHSSAGPVILHTIAESVGPNVEFETSPKFARAVKRFLPEASMETTAAFQASCSNSIDLPPILGLDQRWNLLEREEIETFSRGPTAWGQFHKTYPSAIGISRFSPVGFDAQENQALVALYTLTGRHSNPAYYLLTRDEDGWRVRTQWSLWSFDSKMEANLFLQGSGLSVETEGDGP
jgi:hypothetical protein